MKDLWKGILIACLMIALSYPVVGEVTKLTINTDSTWKCINFYQQGWTSEDYDESWWEPAQTTSYGIDGKNEIWYPGKNLIPKTAYFRKAFEIDGSDILIGELFCGLFSDGGNIELYVNDESLGEITSTYSSPQHIDITSRLRPGKNVIAAKVSLNPTKDWFGWALTGTIRYDKS